MASHMVKDHSDSERRNPLPPHGLLFPISSKDSPYHGLCYSSCGALAGTRISPMGPSHEGPSTTELHLVPERSCGALAGTRNNSMGPP